MMTLLPPAWGTLYLLSRLDDPTICAIWFGTRQDARGILRIICG